MENILAVAPNHEMRKKIEKLLTGAYGYEGLYHLGRTLATRMFFAEAAYCYRQVVKTAPPETDLTDAAAALMEMDVAAHSFEQFEEDMLLALACGYSPAQVRQSLVWALGLAEDLKWTGRMAAWLPRVECWEKLYLRDILPDSDDERKALDELFAELGDSGSPDSVEIRALLQARIDGSDEPAAGGEAVKLLDEIRRINTPEPIMTHFSTNDETPAAAEPAVKIKMEKIIIDKS
jgi:hypothetical protein